LSRAGSGQAAEKRQSKIVAGFWRVSALYNFSLKSLSL
jgi:hypothetical protein